MKFTSVVIVLFSLCLSYSIVVIAGVQQNDSAILKRILGNETNIDEVDKKGLTALHRAVMKRQHQYARILIRNGANIEFKIQSVNAKSAGDTALMVAAYFSDVQMLQILLDNGADIDTLSKTGQTVVQYASYSGDYAKVKYLLERGAKLNRPDRSGRTALLWAIEADKPEIVQLLLDYGADINAKITAYGNMTVLHSAVVKDVYITNLLLENSALIEAKAGNKQLTPLLVATEAGRVNLVMLLLLHGANIEARDSDGNTAIQLAKDTDVISLLQAQLVPSKESTKIINNFKARVDLVLKTEDAFKVDRQSLATQLENDRILIEKANKSNSKEKAIQYYLSVLEKISDSSFTKKVRPTKYQKFAGRKISKLNYKKYKNLFRKLAQHDSAVIRYITLRKFQKVKDRNNIDIIRKISINDPILVIKTKAIRLLKSLNVDE